jgi:hypothetical protein
MKIHLIRSAEMDRERFTKVVDLLKAVPGPMAFECDRDSIVDFDREEVWEGYIPNRDGFEKTIMENRIEIPQYAKVVFPLRELTATWEHIFSKCATYRRTHAIPDDAYVILLTDVRNENNWFAALDGNMTRNGFIHTADWQEFIDCQPAFPIAFEVIALVLQGRIFGDNMKLRQQVHIKPIGCISDLCMHKPEIILKLRTADICGKCMQQLDSRMPKTMIRQALDIMESLRIKMLYSQNFRQADEPGRMIVDHRMHIRLPDLGNIEIKLRPLEKALYRLFLDHPEGIRRTDLPLHRDELFEIYNRLSNQDDIAQKRQRVNDLVSILSNSADEKISRIKRVFTDAVGEDLARHYCIMGERGEPYRIAIDRASVTG